MDKLKNCAKLLIASDLDHTMVDHHDPENLSLLRFNALWASFYSIDSMLVFSTGRSPTLYKKLRSEKPMLTPDITIMSVGTEITYGEDLVPDEDWVAHLNKKWDRDIVIEEADQFRQQLTRQAETEQRPHKVSFYVDKQAAQEVIRSLSERLEKRGLDAKIIYSGGVDLDILPQRAGKGQALDYLLKKFDALGKPPVNTLVCGDSGNDAELFSVPGVHGVMVSNAQEELLQWYADNAKGNAKILRASERCAAGIIQAIKHFELGPSTSPRDLDFPFPNVDVQATDVAVKLYLLYEKLRRGEVAKPEPIIEHLKGITHSSGVIVYPSGAVKQLYEAFDALISLFGDKKGKQFRVWLDRLNCLELAPDTWLVRFDKWEMDGEVRSCGATSLMLNIKASSPGEHEIL